MASVPKATVELSRKLLSNGVQKMANRPCSALQAREAAQLKYSPQGNESNQVEQSDVIWELGRRGVEQTPAPGRLVGSEEIVNSGSLSLQKLAGVRTSGMHWRALMSCKLQQVRFHANVTAGADKCTPRKVKMADGPLPCVIPTSRRKPPCEIPKQKNWTGPCPSICLPCCKKVEKPLSCEMTDIVTNTCPRKTYRLASFSECNRLAGRKRHIKECCYKRRVCYANRSISDKEITPLMPITHRQAEKLGYYAKTPVDPWGS